MPRTPPAMPAPRRGAARLWLRLWRSMSTLLPLLLMLLLAGFSWWVAQQALHALRGREPAAPPQEPDYFLRDFQTRSFDADGRPGALLSGAAMRHIPGDQTVRIEQPVLHVVESGGVVLDARARAGISNADASNIQLLGDAVVQRRAPGAPELSVRSDFLNVFPNTQRVQSNRPTVVQRGAMRLEGDALDFDGIAGTLSVRGAVRATVPGH